MVFRIRPDMLSIGQPRDTRFFGATAYGRESELLLRFRTGPLSVALPFRAPASITTTGIVTPDPATTTASNTLYIGQSGTGTMLVNAGGDVLSDYGYISHNPGSNGTATIDGAGSTWTNRSYLSVGTSGNGTLNVNSGGSVKALGAYVGGDFGGVGIASIDGAGSTLSIDGGLYIGNSGIGTLPTWRMAGSWMLPVTWSSEGRAATAK